MQSNLSPHAWADLQIVNLNGEAEDLEHLVRSHKATVLIWWATQCPCVARYEKRMEALMQNYASSGVAVLAIASNADDDMERIKRVSKARGFNLPLVLDKNAKLAEHLGVRTTPTGVILDSQASVRYKGWIDNERHPNEPGRIAYLENALDELLGSGVTTTDRSPIFGCLITKDW
jgi:peroxiredoxin